MKEDGREETISERRVREEKIKVTVQEKKRK